MADSKDVKLDVPSAPRERNKKQKAARTDIAGCARLLDVDISQGLTSSMVVERIARHGPNELVKAERESFCMRILKQFQDKLVILLCIAAIVAAVLAAVRKEKWEGYIAPIFIIMIVFVNALLGVTQEGKADDAVAALEKKIVSEIFVLREGKKTSTKVADVVPGDILIFDSGTIICADCRIIEDSNCAAEEAFLTGESVPVPKRSVVTEKDLADYEHKKKSEGIVIQEHEDGIHERLTLLYKGSAVAQGTGKAIVVDTGMLTRMGDIVTMMNEVEDPKTPLQERLEDLGDILAIASISVSLIVFIIGVAAKRGLDPNSTQPAWLQMLLIAVSLTVAAVPEGLPVCVTIALAIGMSTMSEKQATVKNLKSVETLGSASVICSDKTGTLTKGEMTAVAFRTYAQEYKVSGLGYAPVGDVSPSWRGSVECAQFFAIAEFCNSAQLVQKNGEWIATGNLTERALLCLSRKANPEQQFKILKDNPFDSARKMASTVVDFVEGKSNPFGSARVTLVKGAPNIILQACTHIQIGSNAEAITQAHIDAVTAQVDAYSEQSYRVLAHAYSNHTDTTLPDVELEKDLVYVGMAAIIDPPRTEVAPAIKKCHGGGIQVVMITGDYAKTAEAIAKQIGLIKPTSKGECIDCQELRALSPPPQPVKETKTDDQKKNDIQDKKDGHGFCPALFGQKEEESNEEKKEDSVKFSPAQRDLVLKTKVFARARPEDKIIIVTILQAEGFVCSMTGDGVNDAPALKKADIGVAMGITGTDAAKAAAQMVLENDSFTSIVDAVEEGRRIYANICKFVYFLLSTNISEVFFILISSIIGLQSPLVPVQILWLNLMTDSLPALALANEPIEEKVMRRAPHLRGVSIIDGTMKTSIFVHTLVLTSVCIGSYIWALDRFTGSWNHDPLCEGPIPTGEWHHEPTTSCFAFPQIQNQTGTWSDGMVITERPGFFQVGKLSSFVDTIDIYNRAKAKGRDVFLCGPTCLLFKKEVFQFNIRQSQTMCMLIINIAELLRAYTSRSLIESVFVIGFWKNWWMQAAVISSISLTIAVSLIPGIKDVLGMELIRGPEWGWVIGLAFLPACADEALKLIYRISGFGDHTIKPL